MNVKPVRAIERGRSRMGVLRREGEVVHLLKHLFDHAELLGRLPTASRDFC